MKQLMYSLFLLMFCIILLTCANAKTLIHCSESAPEHLVPSLTSSSATTDAITNTVFNRLVEFAIGTTDLEPALAEKWHISKDGLTYTFYLRRGVSFHRTKYFKPTRKFNADDVIFTFERQWHKDHLYHNLSGTDYFLFNYARFSTLLKEIRRVDDYIVAFILNQPDATFLSNLTMGFAAIASKEYADTMLKEGTPELFDQFPIGTGPFIFLNYEKPLVLRYRAHPDYWKGKAPIDELIFNIVPDATLRFAKLKQGECHTMSYPSPTDIPDARRSNDLRVLETRGLNVGYLAFNTTKPPFDNPKVRQALNLATNKEAIIEAVYQKGAQVAKGPISPMMWGYDNNTPDYPYDPERAKEILRESGIDPKSLRTDLWAMPLLQPYIPNTRKMVELIQEDWRKIGVYVDIVMFEWHDYIKRVKQGEHTLFLLGINTGNDPDCYMNLQLSCAAAQDGLNWAKWCFPPYDQLVTKAKQEINTGKRIALYHQAQAIFQEQMPWIPIAHSFIYQIISNKVENFKVNPSGEVHFYNVDLKE